MNEMFWDFGGNLNFFFVLLECRWFIIMIIWLEFYGLKYFPDQSKDFKIMLWKALKNFGKTSMKILSTFPPTTPTSLTQSTIIQLVATYK